VKQLTQKLKDGHLRVLDVPAPRAGGGQLLVRTHYSIISAGTESSTVSTARKSYLGKVKERPEQFKQVLESLSQKGLVQTYRAVMKKLEAHSPLGYSCAGEVVEVGSGVTGIAPGDLVACGGAGYANHAEYVAVPVNLAVKLEPGARLDLAAYNTVGAIALQGIRQADLRLGESCAVIGLGLLGQLTCVMLRASGVRVVGVDVLPGVVETAKSHAADAAYTTAEPGLVEKILEFSSGVGVDAVIIAAASSSTEPVNLAGRIARKKGRVVIVGRVPTDFEQDTYYKKELDLRMSCSYGPGRYDINYEERGIDYPPAYVRWTENRNMRAFQEMLASQTIDIDFLTTHTFDIEKAPEAFELILGRKEPYIGVLIRYDTGKPAPVRKIITGAPCPAGKVVAAFIGAGSYAMNNLLPNIGKEASLKGVMTATGTSARSVADRYSFEFCTTDENDIWKERGINTVFVATRHNSHARYLMRALDESKSVFVEKPMCLTPAELDDIAARVAKLDGEGKPVRVMVGYNRRFSPLSAALKERMGDGPMAMIYRVNAGAMPGDQWMQIPDIGGGRIIGEACHFVDYLIFLNGSLPVEVHATVMEEPEHLEDNVNINLRFANGSIGTVSYIAAGSKTLPKEYVEVYKAGVTGVLRDFKELAVYGTGKPWTKKLMSQDKGQPEMMRRFLASVREGTPSPIPFAELHAGMLATFKAVESFRTRRALSL
jgi:predicted dehydrogenase/threonine dehydrogenase-like Zn-dependent dehydrogenase